MKESKESPGTDSAGLICTTPGVDVPRTVTCNEGEQGSATGDTLTWTHTWRGCTQDCNM